MTQAQSGDSVKLHYTGTLTDGTVFDSSDGREPLAFTLGQQQVIPGFENAVMGMSPGDTKTVTIPAEQAYGPHREEMLIQVPPSEFPDHITPKVGDQLQIRQPDGQAFNVVVRDVSEIGVTLDGNHPLAGQDLTFEIELVEVA
ncbi:MAG: peptidylprolyl isomerase [Anaerolineae bacterium]|nr:peptidylprolyl isomerase [Anaerolineae bacterium]